MIKDIIKKNEGVKANDKEMEILKENFPACFDRDGNFDIIKFQELIKDKVDISKEGYELNFLGKSYAKLLASIDTTTVIQPDVDHNSNPENANSENIYISGDNLDALKHLTKSYAGLVKCIYIDPPYNTGSDGFVYNDKFDFTVEDLVAKLSIPEDEAKRILNMTKRGSASHSAWLTFMYPRLLLARDMLKEDGAILISIDDNEQSDLKLLCDHVFGEEKFLGTFIWYKKLTGGYDNDDINTQHEYILCYCKNTNFFNINLHPGESKYKLIDEKTGKLFKWDSLWNVGGLSYSKSLDYAIIAPDGSEIWPVGKKGISFWLWSQEHVEKERESLKFEKDKNGNWKVYKKVYASDGLIPGSITLLDKNVVGGNTTASSEIKKLFDNNKIFDYPKPTKLLYHLLNRFVNSNDLVLDFFSGSASTADTCMQMALKFEYKNIHYISIQLQEKIYETLNGKEVPLSKKAATAAYSMGYKTIDEIGQERIIRAAAKIKAENPDADIDYGFKHFTLVEPNANTLDKLENFEQNSMITDNNLLDEFGKETALATWINDDGYGLTTAPQEIDFAGYKAYYIGKHLYLLDANFDYAAQKALFEKYSNEPEFNPENIVLFGYSFSKWTILDSLQTNLRQLPNKKINFDIRY